MPGKQLSLIPVKADVTAQEPLETNLANPVTDLLSQRQALLQSQATGDPAGSSFGDRFHTFLRLRYGVPKEAALTGPGKLENMNQQIAGQEAQQQIANQQAEANPQHPSSRKAQEILKRLLPTKTADDTKFLESLSLKDIKDLGIIPAFQKMSEMKNQHDIASSKLEGMKAMAGEKAQTKTTADQDKAYSEIGQRIEGGRGVPPHINLAQKNKLFADNALAIVKGKDLNNLSVQDAALVQDELLKIATGGVSTDQGFKHLMPDVLNTRMANLQSFLSSKPTPAQLGGYLQHNIEYLKELRNVSDSTVRDYQKNLLHSYKHRLRPDDYQELQSRHNLGEQPSAGTTAGGTDFTKGFKF